MACWKDNNLHKTPRYKCFTNYRLQLCIPLLNNVQINLKIVNKCNKGVGICLTAPRAHEFTLDCEGILFTYRMWCLTGCRLFRFTCFLIIFYYKDSILKITKFTANIFMRFFFNAACASNTAKRLVFVILQMII